MPQVKRKHYDAAYYALMLQDLTQIMNQVPKLRADRDSWDIEGDWADTGTIHFVDAAYQPYFTRFTDFDCRSIKIVNYGRPAVRMSFFKEHKFWVIKDKDLPRDEKIARIQLYLNDLGSKEDRMRSKLHKLSGSELTQAKANIALWQSEQTAWKELMAHVDTIEMAISNYERVHKYVTLNYKFILNEEGDFANEQEHMLNPQKDRTGTINQPRYNIIFIDTDHIRRDHPYQSKQIDKYLGGFGLKSQAGLYTLYARIRPELDSIASFETSTSTLNGQPIIEPLSAVSRRRTKPKPAPLFDQSSEQEY
ncbi:hypothetical protein [Spirosoma endophyticum]|uniref:Uncharacterized protein n=1 Tax=Spirosoma endophyticum TaxID=662367 RepID=A0A1I2HIV7_9BACT|nr:hypothetical protein [Spirosoma endophyticum]SFF28696.1 hypothetical protein SAMN05216167_1438 [Spirosoma endophyticum]